LIVVPIEVIYDSEERKGKIYGELPKHVPESLGISPFYLRIFSLLDLLRK
jgi:hypothetical protein